MLENDWMIKAALHDENTSLIYEMKLTEYFLKVCESLPPIVKEILKLTATGVDLSRNC